jgi:UDP-N-acetylglucosamine 2-epimerase (non-hydrolysing)
MLNIDLIAGTRPNLIKIAALIEAIRWFQSKGVALRYRFIFTGQHHDPLLSQSIMDELNLPQPDIDFRVGSGTHAAQTAAIVLHYESELAIAPPDLCVVVGDVNSTLAAAIAAKKLGIPVAHVEAGLRSGDWAMPEEVNRVAVDSISDWWFTTTEEAKARLESQGAPVERVHFVGNTMADTLLRQRPRLYPPECWESLQLLPRQYIVLTLHRPSNVDDPQQLNRLLTDIATFTKGVPVVFPVHPRTAQVMTKNNLLNKVQGIHPIAPLTYLSFNYLVEHAMGVLTDSGGISEETTILGVPCLTLRNSTERPETVTIGTNALIGTDTLGAALTTLTNGQWKKGQIPQLWDGHAAERIIETLIR